MNERQRMQYLDAMGVDSFVPRWVLPGARASVACPLPIADTADASADHYSTPAFERPAANTAIGSVVERLLKDAPNPPAAAELTPEPSPIVSATQPVVGEDAAFTLAFWQLGTQLLVVDSRQAKALPTEALLREILAALGLAGRLPQAEMQTWPMAGTKDKSWPAAAETVQMYLEGRLARESVRFMVVMGQDAARVVVPASHGETPEYGQFCLEPFGCEAIVAPSLADLLLTPQHKARLWQLLMPLRDALSAS